MQCNRLVPRGAMGLLCCLACMGGAAAAGVEPGAGAKAAGGAEQVARAESAARAEPAARPEPADYCTLDLAAQSVDGALQAIGRDCGIELAYFSEVTQGLKAPALRGSYPVDEALRLVLEHSGLVFRHINPETIEIRPAPPAAARKQRNIRKHPPQAPGDDQGAVSEVLVTATAEGLVATRTQTPLIEIPQTITVIPAEQMRQQDNTTIDDALRDAVGITSVQYDSGNQLFISRGFQVTTYHLDGGAALHFMSFFPPNNVGPLFFSPDLGEFDHIEVLRGADALFGADGNPGATVNLIRKRPSDVAAATLTSKVGSWHNYREELDVTGPLAFSGALRGRLDAAYVHRDYFYQGANLERKNVFAVLAYDFSPATTLTVGGSYSAGLASPFVGGLPEFADGSDAHLPRGTALTFTWSRYQTYNRELYAQFQQDFGSSWRLRVNASYLGGTADYAVAQFFAPVNEVTRRLDGPPYGDTSAGPSRQTQPSVDATLTGSADWLGHQVEMALGGDYLHFDAYVPYRGLQPFGPPDADPYHYDPQQYPFPLGSSSSQLPYGFSDTRTVQAGVYASLKVQLSTRWSATGGLRMTRERVSTAVGLVAPSVGGRFSSPYAYASPTKLTPFFGTMFAASATYSLYASYADIEQSNNGLLSPAGFVLAPQDGVDMEAGLKAQWHAGALNGTLAFYKIVQRGIATYAPKPAGTQTSIDCCYLPDGREVSRGVDLESSGSLADGWLVGAGYTFNNNVNLTQGPFYNGPATAQTPRHLLKLWTSKRLPGKLSRWTLGGTVHAQSANFYVTYDCPTYTCSNTGLQYLSEKQGSYAIADARVEYDLGSHWKLALRIDNAFDHTYYQTVGIPSGGNWYGEPRNYTFTVTGSL